MDGRGAGRSRARKSIAPGVTLGATLLVGVLHPANAAAQTRALGVVLGPVDAVQIHDRGEDSESQAGFMVGVWIDQQTPASWFSVTVEGGLARRGATYDAVGGLQHRIDVDYVLAGVLPTARVSVGPASLVAFAGPSLDILLRTRASVELEQALRDAAPQVFSGVVGGGAEYRHDRATFRVEARIHQQLATAFKGGVGSVKHRSVELLFRMGMRPRR